MRKVLWHITHLLSPKETRNVILWMANCGKKYLKVLFGQDNKAIHITSKLLR